MTGQEQEVVFNHQQLVELNNSGRPDKNPIDHSGPAQLRLVLEVEGKQYQMLLPVHLDHQIANNTYFVTLTGAAESTLT